VTGARTAEERSRTAGVDRCPVEGEDMCVGRTEGHFGLNWDFEMAKWEWTVL
jgi:hypothetical protein